MKQPCESTVPHLAALRRRHRPCPRDDAVAVEIGNKALQFREYLP
ncbi:MAG: hypothetical protein ACSHWQ_07430 [Spongiibacteraceae bacterium]